MTQLVGLDVGTTGVKAIAISPDGDVLARAEEGYPLSMPRPGWAEQDPEDWWRTAERDLTSVTGSDPVKKVLGTRRGGGRRDGCRDDGVELVTYYPRDLDSLTIPV